MNFIISPTLSDFGQAARVPTHDAAAIVVLAVLTLAALAIAYATLKNAPAFNPIELCGPKDKID